MAVIKNKVWTKKTPTSDPVLERLFPETADILKVSPTGVSDEELIRVVPYGNDVDTQSLLKVISDLVSNDVAINEELVATSEIISEGVFDVSKSELTTNEENELTDYKTTIDNEGISYLSADELIRYNYLIRLKYGYKFDLAISTISGINVNIGPGKFKVNVEESKSGVYFISQINDFDVNEITVDNLYRLDLVNVVFRDSNPPEDKTVPYIEYIYGDEETEPSPGHVISNRTLTPTKGTFPIWSILYKKESGSTVVVRSTRVAGFVGLRALIELKQLVPHFLTSNLINYFSVNHYKDIALRDFNGDILNAEYGEGNIIEEIAGPNFDMQDDQNTVAPSPQGVPNNFELLKNGSNQTIPFILTEKYNEYLKYESVIFKKFYIGMDKYVGVPNEEKEGLELHFYSVNPFCTSSGATEIEIDINKYNMLSGAIYGSPSLPVSSVAFKINNDLSNFNNLKNDDNTISETSDLIQSGDFVMVTYGKGYSQISEILYIYGENENEQNVLVTKPFKIFLDDKGSYSSNPRITIFKSSTEKLIGDAIRDEFGNNTAYYNNLSADDKTEIDTSYPFSDHTGITRLPWDSGDSRKDIQLSYESSAYDILETSVGAYDGYRKIEFNLKLKLQLNKWYFIKTQVFQKPEPNDTYFDQGKPKVIYTDPAHADLQTFDRLGCWFETIYIKNFGLYQNTSADGRRIVKITDKYGDIQNNYNYRTFDDKPLYWRLIAKNLDNEILELPPAKVNDIGTCYFDVIRGKFLFHPDDIPTDVKIDCIVDNVLNGKSDTENLLHIESESEVITLSSKLSQIDTAIAELTVNTSATKLMTYRGANSKIYKYDTYKYNFIQNNVKNLGTQVYLCDNNAVQLKPQIVEQRYPISRLAEENTDAFSLARANNSIGLNVFDDTSESNTTLREFTIPVVAQTTGDFDENDQTKKINFTIATQSHMGDVFYGKRFGFKISDRKSNIAQDIGIDGSANEWVDGIYLAIHDQFNNSLITSENGVHWTGSGIGSTEYALKLDKTKIEAIYNEFEKRGNAVQTSGYQEVLLSNANADANAGLTNGDYDFIINGEAIRTITATTDDSYGDIIDKINTTFSNNYIASFEQSAIRISNYNKGVGNDVLLTTAGTTNDELFTSLLDYNILDTAVDGKDGYLTDLEAQDKMWLYFEVDTPIEFIEDEYHFHLFVKYVSSDTTQPKIFQYNEAKWLWQNSDAPTYTGEGIQPDALWKTFLKLFALPLKYTDGGEYVGGYGIEEYMPGIIDLYSDLIIPLRDGRTLDKLDWALNITDEYYNLTPDVKITDIMPADLSGYEKWEGWNYNNYIGIDPTNGRIKIPEKLYWPSNTFTGTTHLDSKAIDGIADTSDLKVGMDISGVGIPTNTKIVYIDSANSITVNNESTANGSITITNKMDYNFDVDLLFGSFNAKWPFSSVYTQSFGDADDPNVSLHDKRFSEIRTKNESISIVDDDYKRARLAARSIYIDWMEYSLYKIDDIITFDNRIYKCNTEHTSGDNFINDIANWSLVSGGGGTVYDIDTDPYTHNFSIGDVIRYKLDTVENEGDPNFGWLKALADDPDHLGHAIVLRVNDVDHLTLMSSGHAPNFIGTYDEGIYTENITDDEGNALQPNTMYYLSKTVEGKITKYRPFLGQTVFYTMGANNPNYVSGSSNPAEYPWVTDCIIDVDDTDYSSVSKVENFVISADDVTQIELLNYPIAHDYVDISINGVLQHSGYTLTDRIVTFNSPLVNGQKVRIKYDFSIRSTPSASIETSTIIATEGQTEFIFNELSQDPIGKRYCFLTINGWLVDDDVYEMVGRTVTFPEGVSADNVVRIKSVLNLNIVTPDIGSVGEAQFGNIELYKNNEKINDHIIVNDEDRRFTSGPVEIVYGQTVELQGSSVLTIL